MQERQKYLAERLEIKPDVRRSFHLFKNIDPKSSRADVEWLLATHEGGRGPVDWSDENQHEREGIGFKWR